MVQEINEHYKNMSFDGTYTKISEEEIHNILNAQVEDQCIFIALKGEEIVAAANIKLNRSDYIFFVENYVLIKYLYVREDIERTSRENIIEALIEAIIKDIKQYDFKYICADIGITEKELLHVYEKNGLKKYRNRLYKEVNDKNKTVARI